MTTTTITTPGRVHDGAFVDLDRLLDTLAYQLVATARTDQQARERLMVVDMWVAAQLTALESGRPPVRWADDDEQGQLWDAAEFAMG